MLHKLTLRQKQLILIGWLLATIAVLAGSDYVLGQANRDLALAYQEQYLAQRLADELRHSSDDLTRLARTYVVTGDPRWEAQYNEVVNIRAGKQPRPAGYEGIYWDFRAADMPIPGKAGEQISLLDMMKRAGFTKEELAQLEEAGKRSGDLVQTEVVAMNLVKGLHVGDGGALVKGTPDLEKARQLMHDAAYHANKAKIMEPLAAFFKLLDTRTQAQIHSAEQRAASWTWIQRSSGAVMLALFCILLYAVFTNIAVSMRRAVTILGRVEYGDLTQRTRAEGRDEVAQLLQTLMRMQNGLTKVVTTVRDGSHTVADASAEITESSDNLSMRTESQASALQQTAASMEQLATTVQQNANNARQANQLAQGASEVANRGAHIVREVTDTMQGISDSAHKIADIIGVIDGIAFQTNILALNAAVEAARAGEQGRGFAVVASEVRNLAGRAADAAKEIKALIDESVQRVSAGSSLASNAGSTMQEVVGSIQRVTSIMGEISAASSEQALGVQQISRAVSDMDQATQQNAALVEEMVAAASSLSTQADELVSAVAVFRLERDDKQQLAGASFAAKDVLEPLFAPG